MFFKCSDLCCAPSSSSEAQTIKKASTGEVSPKNKRGSVNKKEPLPANSLQSKDADKLGIASPKGSPKGEASSGKAIEAPPSPIEEIELESAPKRGSVLVPKADENHREDKSDKTDKVDEAEKTETADNPEKKEPGSNKTVPRKSSAKVIARNKSILLQDGQALDGLQEVDTTPKTPASPKAEGGKKKKLPRRPTVSAQDLQIQKADEENQDMIIGKAKSSSSTAPVNNQVSGNVVRGVEGYDLVECVKDAGALLKIAADQNFGIAFFWSQSGQEWS